MKRYRYIRIFLMVCLLAPSFMLSQVFNSLDEMDRNDKIILLHRLDSLIYEYQSYGHLMEGIRFTQYRINQFENLFYQDARLFDDATPNFREGNEDVIWEMQKNLDTYINDIQSFYRRINIRLIRTNLGNPLDRATIEDGFIIIPVEIEKELTGFTDGKGEYTTTSNLILTTAVPLRTFRTQNPKIRMIEKKDVNSCEWNFQPPPQKISRFKPTLFVKGAYANLSLNEQFSYSFMTGTTLSSNMAWSVLGELRLNLVDHERQAFGLSLGAGSSFYGFTYAVNNYQNVELQTDPDDDTYFRIVDGENILENWSLMTLDVPMHFNLELGFGRMGVYVSGGVGLSVFMKKKYTATGIFDYSGYYPQYDLLLENTSYYDFVSGKQHNSIGNLNVESYYFTLDAGTGITLKFPEAKLMLYAGISLQNSLTPLIKQPDEYTYTTMSSSQYTSILSEQYNVHLDTYGFQIGIRKFIARIKKKKTVMRYGTY